jgi:hypothetical protein
MRHPHAKKIILTTLIAGAVFMFSAAVFPIHTQAAAETQNYELLAPLPCDAGTTGCTGSSLSNIDTSSPVVYIKLMYQILISLAVVIAVFIIVLGGIQTMSTDNISQKTEGKKKIKQALIGLVLVASSWIILYTVNPDILNLNALFDAGKSIAEKNRSNGPQTFYYQILYTKGTETQGRYMYNLEECNNYVSLLQQDKEVKVTESCAIHQRVTDEQWCYQYTDDSGVCKKVCNNQAICLSGWNSTYEKNRVTECMKTTMDQKTAENPTCILPPDNTL